MNGSGPETLSAHDRRLQWYGGLASVANDKLWTLLSQRVVINDRFEVAITRTVMFNSEDAWAELVKLHVAYDWPLPEASEEVFVPLPPANPHMASENRVVIISSQGSRRVEPLPFSWLEVVAGLKSHKRPRDRLPAMMTLEEFRSWPVVRLTTTTAVEPPNRLSIWRQILPVSYTETKDLGDSLVATVVLSLPSEARVDRVAIEGRLRLSYLSERLRTLERTLERPRASEPADRELSGQLAIHHEELTKCCRQASALVASVMAAVGARHATATRELQPSSPSLSELNDAKYALDALDGKLGGIDISQKNKVLFLDVIRDLEEVGDSLRNVLTDRRFTAIAEVSKGGLIDTDFLPESTPESDRRTVSLSRLTVPFTSEAQTKYHRWMGATLTGLALFHFLLGPSLVFFTVDYISTQSSTYDGLQRVLVDGDVRTSLVTLVLLFPAVLYGLLFQARPTTQVARRTAGALYLSVQAVISLPVVVAFLIAIGSPLAVVGWVCIAIGILALSMSLVILVLFSPKRLGGFRYSEAESALALKVDRDTTTSTQQDTMNARAAVMNLVSRFLGKA